MKPKITRYDGEQRFYEIEGVGKFPSVTTILGVISKPFLVNWAKKQVALAIQPILQDLFDHKIKPKDLDVDAIIKMAKAKPKEIMEEAGDIGTQVHKKLEILVKLKMENPNITWELLVPPKSALLLNADPKVMSCVEAFLKWAIKVDFRPVESELMVYSKSLCFAGTLDAVGLVNNVLSVVDFKSSNAFHEDMGLQISAYRHAYAEMNKKKKVSGMLILRLGKLDGDFEAIKINNPAKHLIAFRGALALWKWKQNLKQ